MPKKLTVVEATSQVYEVLEALEPQDRKRVISAVRTLLGDAGETETSGDGSGGSEEEGRGGSGSSGEMTAAQYFAEKAPDTKVERLAVAARYRELYEKQESHTKDDFSATFKEARHNFDAHNVALI